MAAYYLTANHAGGATLCLSPLTDRQVAASDVELHDTSGHFLYECVAGSRDNVRVLAQVMSEDAVEAIRGLLGLG